ncbi:MAG: hypothetical protein BMS9Abin20_0197 [Acidimicrobiia bacterium]|nr:MAG: hypothetical protein BMS9Abin20_0197 [Acidimicrobiia bacterium]
MASWIRSSPIWGFSRSLIATSETATGSLSQGNDVLVTYYVARVELRDQ